jgi:hypothetical protein
LIPSVVVGAFAAWVGAQREYLIDSDYMAAAAVIGTLGFALGRRVQVAFALVMLLVLMSVDTATIYLKSFFLSPTMVIDTLPFIWLWPWQSFLVPAAFVVVMSILLSYFCVMTRARAGVLPALVLLLGAYGADAALRLVGRQDINLVSSSAQHLIQPAVNHLWDRWTAQPVRFDSIASDTIKTRLDSATLPATIVSITVESLGVRRMGEQDWSVLARNLSPDYELAEQGRHSFEGATLAGELRELCGLRISSVPYSGTELAALKRCAPRQLSARGYRVTAYHGGDSWFYNRAIVYRAAGFQQSVFYDDLIKGVKGPCAYLMVAICDADLVRLALARLVPGQREFMHLMTIDTHLPVPEDSNSCPKGHLAQECAYSHRMRASLEGIADAFRHASVKPDLIFVTGDHAPPFMDRRARAAFEDGMVPFLVFKKVDYSRNDRGASALHRTPVVRYGHVRQQENPRP